MAGGERGGEGATDPAPKSNDKGRVRGSVRLEGALNRG